jgi:hypothetical protein
MSALVKLLAAVTVDKNGNVSGGSGFVDANRSVGEIIGRGVNVFAFFIGAISIIMILVGALRYVLSGGNPQATKEAKDTILYAVIGLVIAVLSLAIARYISGAFA